jgi:hypothetical protein
MNLRQTQTIWCKILLKKSTCHHVLSNPNSNPTLYVRRTQVVESEEILGEISEDELEDCPKYKLVSQINKNGRDKYLRKFPFVLMKYQFDTWADDAPTWTVKGSAGGNKVEIERFDPETGEKHQLTEAVGKLILLDSLQQVKPTYLMAEAPKKRKRGGEGGDDVLEDDYEFEFDDEDNLTLSELLNGGATKKGKKSPKKKVKDPNAPKAPKGSYIFFSMDARPKFKEADPNLSFGDLAKKFSAAWKEMDAEAKQPYEEQAAADKERYKRETAEYEAKKTEALAMLSSPPSAGPELVLINGRIVLKESSLEIGGSSKAPAEDYEEVTEDSTMIATHASFDSDSDGEGGAAAAEGGDDSDGGLS